MRADGQQNRQRLIDAAEQLFAQRGSSVNVAEIVAAAGLTLPTLYRHFGDKDGLIRAISERATETDMARLAHALTRPTAREGLREAVSNSVATARNNRAARDRRGLAVSPALEKMLLSGWGELVRRGHEEGSMREEFTATDVPFLFSAAAAVADAVGYEPVLVERYLDLLLASVRPAEEPLSGRPPTHEELRRAFR